MPSSILSTAFPAFSFAAPGEGATRRRVSLNGAWERRLGDELYDVVEVPSSHPPLGAYTMRRKFLLPAPSPGGRTFLRFESIHYYGRPSVNGAALGEMGPYVPYEFEITSRAREGENEVEVALTDAGPGREEIVHCLSPGWEASGGIVREVYVEFRPAAFIDNTAFAYTLAEGYGKASCRARLMLSSAAAGPAQAEVVLMHGNTEVGHAAKQVDLAAGASETELAFEVDNPLLWSPEVPNLYRLVARLKTQAGEDEWRCRTGFRDVRIEGRNFLLNGKRLVLAGVCRHDLWKDQGFTLTRDQMAQDMRMIKTMGANFVRLVHYPHHRHVIELAEELGLLVTEEPGHWNVEFKDMPRARIDVSLAIMERTIRRDWNSPAVFAWLLGNECAVTPDYLREGKALCNRLDPIRRPVSFAHIYGNSKQIFDEGGTDFYTAHMYDFDDRKFRKAAETFGDAKPLVHTEWGWETPSHDQIVYERSFDRMLDMVEQEKLAGHSFWSWQDVREYSRKGWPIQNGILMSGVVDEAREPRERLYVELARLFQRRRHEPVPVPDRPETAPLRFHTWSPRSRLQTVDLQPLADSDAAAKAWAELEARMAKYWAGTARGQWERTGAKFELWKGGEIEVEGVAFHCPVHEGRVRPLLVTPEAPELTIPLGLACTQLHILGNVTLPDGYPSNGRPGETVATYTLSYGAAKPRQFPLRNGIEVARANMIHRATRLDPIAAAAPRALTFMKDVVRERYQVLLFSVPVAGGKADRLHVRLNSGAEPLALFAITAERA
ncbi:MAG TPA: glycoside hydrolase family 2 TIM barrel-domain containing protein [Bryobacteraceae bacterium]|nr:glycoside hydrolase family 2 TIM barrel-domain containing protein [Bryobacteraceae bacterium]